MSFCPVCGAHHDPKMPCADRAGELLRDMGIAQKPMDEKELKKTIRKANRSLFVLLIVLLILVLPAVLLTFLKSSNHVWRSARDDYNSGIAWYKEKKYDKAVGDFTEAIAAGQLSAEGLSIAHYARGSAWYGADEYDKAIADYGEAIRLDPKFSKAYYMRGILLLLRGDFDRTIADCDDLLRRSPLPDATVYRIRGIARFNKGEFSSAASDLMLSERFIRDTYTSIWLYLARARGKSDGKTELMLNTKDIDAKKWPAPVVALYLGEADPGRLTAQAAAPDMKTQKEHLCEANFFLGEWHLIHNGKQEAFKLFTRARNECPKNSFQYSSAIAELQRQGSDGN